MQKEITTVAGCLLLACAAAFADAPKQTKSIGDADGLQSLKKILPKQHHDAAEFLAENMPERDRKTLSISFIAENIEYAFKARDEMPWGNKISSELFLNYVLPYANLDEKRDPWRKQFYEELSGIVKAAASAGEAAIQLNTTIYDKLNVHYSKQRPKANQSPAESIAAGKASCTGLSILLVNACRAFCIPARVVGTPRWVKGGGNHTWVEVWDDGWHSIGAAESKALDKTWFAKKASGQKAGDPLHAIYAVSFKKTDKHFPLVWAPRSTLVSATDVTERYALSDSKTVAVSEISKQLRDSSLEELLVKLSKKDVLIKQSDLDKVRELVWKKYSEGIQSDEKRLKEHSGKAVTYDGATMRYEYKRVGEKPASGYPLYIAMHGGGGAPARVNDSQWQHMKVYYLKGVTNGIYLAPRGVNNEWNLHWRKQSFACYDRIIENMIVLEGVDPNRVYIMGFSAGGDAAYQIPARMPDRWAGAGMSAGHPNGASPENYANLAFLLQVGAKDSAYKRNKVGAEYGVKLQKLQSDNPGLYEYAAYLHAGRGHNFMDHGPLGTKQSVFADPAEWLEKGPQAAKEDVDCNSIRWLDRHVREPLPKKVIWNCKTRCERSGSAEEGFWPSAEKGNLHYWLGLDRYDKDTELEAERIVAELDRKSNAVTIDEIGNFAHLYINEDMLDLGEDVSVKVAGKVLKVKPDLSLKVVLQSLLDRGDPNYIFPVRLTLSRNPEGTWMLEQ